MSTVKIGIMGHVVNGVEAGVLYQVRKTRSTGAWTQVLDLRNVEGADTKYALHCLTHGEVHGRDTRLPAEQESHKSHMWCTGCASGEVKVPEAKVSRIITLDGTPDEVKAFAGMMPAPAMKAPAKARRNRK
jgi:hypothetical protein